MKPVLTLMPKVAAMAIALGLLAGNALAAGVVEVPPRNTWSFSGPFGTFDNAQLQRGFKVYREVCASCHSMSSSHSATSRSRVALNSPKRRSRRLRPVIR